MVRAFHGDPARKPIPKPIHLSVNQLLETASSNAARSHRDAPTALDGFGSPCAEVTARDKRESEAANSGILKKGRVLLLEANAFFREAIADCLGENGYQIVSVRDSHEGLREVMAGDFALVLYDPRMPGLSAETFYRSVGRIDPGLCERLVFMSEDRVDANAVEFIKRVNGLVLKKPFDVRTLMGALTLAELQCSLHSVFDRAAAEPVPLRPVETEPSGTQVPEQSALDEKVAAILARGETLRRTFSRAETPGRISDALPNPEPHLRASGMSLSYALAALTLVFGLAAVLWLRYLNAQDRLDAVSSQRLGREAEWTAVSLDLQTALAMRAKAATAQSQLARIYAIRARPHWAPVLRCIVPPGDAKIEILEVSARGEKKDPGACEVRICGMALGSQPRLMADRYRQSMEQMLKTNANGRPVSTRLDQLDDASETLKEKRADFVMVVTIGSIEQAPAMSKEGR